MRRISLIFITYLIATIGTSAVFAQSANTKIVKQIMKIEAEFNESSKKLSAEDFERISVADFTMTVLNPPRLVTKAENMARLKDVNFRRGTIDSLTSDDVKVRVYSNYTAIVTGAWKRVSRDGDGKNTSASGRFTRVWIKQKGKWLLAAAHYSPNLDLEKLKAKTMPNTTQTNEKIQ